MHHRRSSGKSSARPTGAYPSSLTGSRTCIFPRLWNTSSARCTGSTPCRRRWNRTCRTSSGWSRCSSRGRDAATTASAPREPPQLIPQSPPASDQYKAAVEVAWSNKKIDAPEVESLVALARRIGLAESAAAEIEREVMGDTKQTLALREHEETAVNHARPATENKQDAGMKPRHTFCRKCGDRIIAGDKFCRKCGERLA